MIIMFTHCKIICTHIPNMYNMTFMFLFKLAARGGSVDHLVCAKYTFVSHYF